jgi:hypothetical protein
MKCRRVVEILTESYEEQQFILEKFPGLWWEMRGENTVFYTTEERLEEINIAISEYERMSKNAT